jgi:hypothetical protein
MAMSMNILPLVYERVIDIFRFDLYKDTQFTSHTNRLT